MKLKALFILIFLSSSLAGAIEPLPAKSLRSLDRPVPERAYRVKTARAILFDRGLMESDFPFLKGKPDADFKTFLLHYSGYMAIPQLEQIRTNSQIIFDPADSVIAYRPDYYRRALVYLLPDGSLLDNLGDGSLTVMSQV